MENNKKYIGTSWIDDGSEEGFKKSFLESLLKQWQGEGNGFNADKLDGKHYCEIINDIDDRTQDLIPDFQIGYVHINKDRIEEKDKILYIGFDGVRLNVPGEDGYDDYQHLPWDDGSETRVTPPNVLNAFEELYNIVKSKVDQSEFDDFCDEATPKLDSLEDFRSEIDKVVTYDENGSIIGLNATSINGLRVYVRTPSQYQAMKDDPETYGAILNDIHNLFILTDKDTEESDFTDDILAQQPDTEPISQYYKFRVNKKPVTIEYDNGEVKTVYYLQYKHAKLPDDDEYWNNMCTTEEFIDTNAINSALIEALSNNPNYELNPSAFTKTLKNVDMNDSSDYNIPKYIRWSGIRNLTCLKYDIDIPTTPAIDDANKYGTPRTADLSNLVSKIEEVVDQKINNHMNSIYPIGHIYMTTDNRNPSKILGIGTWEKIEGRFLIGSGNIIEDNNTYNFSNTNIGGRIYQSLSENEMPIHKHTQSSHAHGLSNESHDEYFIGTHKDGGGRPQWYETGLKKGTGGQSQFTHSAMVNTEGVNVYLDELKETDRRSGETSVSGGGKPHYNLPPYYVVNIWRRVK